MDSDSLNMTLESGLQHLNYLFYCRKNRMVYLDVASKLRLASQFAKDLAHKILDMSVDRRDSIKDPYTHFSEEFKRLETKITNAATLTQDDDFNQLFLNSPDGLVGILAKYYPPLAFQLVGKKPSLVFLPLAKNPKLLCHLATGLEEAAGLVGSLPIFLETGRKSPLKRNSKGGAPTDASMQFIINFFIEKHGLTPRQTAKLIAPHFSPPSRRLNDGEGASLGEAGASGETGSLSSEKQAQEIALSSERQAQESAFVLDERISIWEDRIKTALSRRRKKSPKPLKTKGKKRKGNRT